jgi:hypothetical protein
MTVICINKTQLAQHLTCISLLCLFVGSPLFSQTRPVLLAAEITVIEKKLSDPKLPAAERKQTLEKAARLFELSGNPEGAARAWKDAAGVLPGNSGHNNLLNSARCFAAIGEFETAESILQPIFASSGEQGLLIRARLLLIQMDAFKTGNTLNLVNLLGNRDFIDHKPALYYMIWRISGDPATRTTMAARLQSEFPGSPETRMVRNDTVVTANPAALWFLAGSPAAPEWPGGHPALQQNDILPAGDTGSEYKGTMLQTGLFSREENARSMAERLGNAGFAPVIIRKTVNGKDHWAVGAKPGLDILHTMRLLKDRGFESFPVNQ